MIHYSEHSGGKFSHLDVKSQALVPLKEGKEIRKRTQEGGRKERKILLDIIR